MTNTLMQTFGLCLTHNRLKVKNIKELLRFYQDKFGMTYLSEITNKSSKETSNFLGFGGNKGENLSNEVTMLELVSPISEDRSRKEMVNVGEGDTVYWKIGISMPDVDKAVENLRKSPDMSVGNPGQFRDIGYLCHLNDPDSFSIELLQYYFKDRKKAYEVLPQHPLGQKAVFGMITLRVRDIEASLRFYRDILGMKLICKEDVSVYGFYLYFLAFTNDNPPNPDINAEENREWTYQRPCTLIELQSYVKPPNSLQYKDVGKGQFGFMGLGIGTSDISGLKAHLEKHHNRPVSAIDGNNEIFSTPVMTTTDPDGIPIRFSQF